MSVDLFGKELDPVLVQGDLLAAAPMLQVGRTCPECGKAYHKTPGGWLTCPKGHGKLLPPPGAQARTFNGHAIPVYDERPAGAPAASIPAVQAEETGPVAARFTAEERRRIVEEQKARWAHQDGRDHMDAVRDSLPGFAPARPPTLREQYQESLRDWFRNRPLPPEGKQPRVPAHLRDMERRLLREADILASAAKDERTQFEVRFTERQKIRFALVTAEAEARKEAKARDRKTHKAAKAQEAGQ